jgi:adenylate kinase
MPSPRLVLVLTGVPGVGKTTVSERLADMIGGAHIDLSAFAEGEGLTVGWDERRETAIVDMNAVRERLDRVLNSTSGPLVIEGHFAADVVPSDVASFIFVLRRAPWVLKDELEARGYGMEKVWENVDAELLGVCLVEAMEAYGTERVCELDTTDLTETETAEAILSMIDGRVPCQMGMIDWLGRVESEWLLEGSRCPTSS